MRTKSAACEVRVSRSRNDSRVCRVRYSCVGAPVPHFEAVERARIDPAGHRVAGAHASIANVCKTGDFSRGRRVAISISRAGLPPRRSHSQRVTRQFVTDFVAEPECIGDRALG